MASVIDLPATRPDPSDTLWQCIEAVPASIAIYDRDMRHLAASRAYCEIMRLDASAVKGLSIYDVLPEMKERWIETLGRCMAGASEIFEAECHSAGEANAIWCRWQVAPWRTGDGTVGGLAVQVQDITVERAERRAKSETPGRFERIVDALPMWVAKIDAGGRFAYINRVGASWLARSPDELIGKLPREVKDVDRQCASELAHKGQAGSFIKYPDGIQRWCEIFQIPDFGPTGEPDGYHVVLFDVTAARTAEIRNARLFRQYKTLADSLPVFMLHFDREWRVDIVNRTAAQWMARSESAIIGRSLGELISDMAIASALNEPAPKILEQLKAAAMGEPSEREVEFRFPDGNRRWCTSIRAPDIAEDGTSCGLFLLMLDITAKKAESAKRAASEARFSAFMDALPAAAWIKDANGRFVFMNRALKGLSNEKHNAEMEERRQGSDLQILTTASTIRTEFETRSAETGERRHWETVKFPIHEESGDLLIGGIAIDSTANKHASDLLEASEARFRAFMEALPATAVMKDPEGHYVYMNKPWASLGSGVRETWLGKTVADMMPADVAQRAHRFDREVLEEGKTADYVAEYSGPDGAPVFWHHLKFPISGPTGQRLLGMISLDVTRERLLERQNAESSARRAIVVEAANIGSWDWDLATDRVAYSSKWKQQIGYGEDEIADTLDEWRSRVHPDDFQATWEAAERCVQGKSAIYDVEFRFRHKNGSYRWIHCVGTIIKHDGSGPGRFMGTHIDITDRKTAELSLRAALAQYALVMENIPACVIHIGADLRIRFANRSAQEWYGRPLSEIVDRNLADLGLPAQEIFRHVLAGAPGTIDEKVRFPDGVERWCHLGVAPERDSAGNVCGFFVFGIDETERHLAEERLRETSKDEALGQATGGIAHDFNNLLMVVSGNLKLLERRVANDASLSGYVATASRAAQRGAELTKRLLTFARRIPLQPETVGVNHLVREAVEMFDRVLGETISVVMDLQAAPDSVSIDPAQMQSALLNIAVNARDAMGGTGRLEIKTCNVADVPGANMQADQGFVHLTVSDNGAGMPPAVLSRVFEPFFTTKGPGKGSGLGLSMVYGFVRQSGGHVHIDSKVGEIGRAHV